MLLPTIEDCQSLNNIIMVIWPDFLINQKRWCNCQELWCQVPTCLHHIVSTPRKHKLYAVSNCSQIGFFLQFCDICKFGQNFPKIRKTSQTFYTLKIIISQVRNIRSPVSVHLAKSARLLHPNPKIKAAIFYWVGPTLLIWVPCLWLPIVRTHKFAGSLDNFVQHWCLSSLKSFLA